MAGFNFKILDEWREDVDNLLACFLPYCDQRFRNSGLTLEPSHTAIINAHSDWVVFCDEWISSHMLPQQKSDISHIKKAAALLYMLKKHRAVSVFHTGHEVRNIGVCKNQKMRQKLLGGDTAYICFIYLLNIIQQYEKHRINLKTEYQSRINEEFEKDFIGLMQSEDVSPRAIHVIFKALFLRD